MFIRENKTYNKKNKSTYITHRLVESYRTEKGSRQKVVLHLGTLTLPKSQWRNLAIVLESRLTGQQQMLVTDQSLYKIADEAILHNNLLQKRQEIMTENKKEKQLLTIDISSLGTQEFRTLGAEIVASDIWNKIGFSDILKKCKFSDREIAIAKVAIAGRLICPSSDLDTWKWFRNISALTEFLPVNISNVGKNKIYEITDLLLENKTKIESLLRKKADEIFPRENMIYLYDLTNTYFEGNCLNNEIARRGKCKSNRTDCPLVTLALVVDSNLSFFGKNV